MVCVSQNDCLLALKKHVFLWHKNTIFLCHRKAIIVRRKTIRLATQQTCLLVSLGQGSAGRVWAGGRRLRKVWWLFGHGAGRGREQPLALSAQRQRSFQRKAKVRKESCHEVTSGKTRKGAFSSCSAALTSAMRTSTRAACSSARTTSSSLFLVACPFRTFKESSW